MIIDKILEAILNIVIMIIGFILSIFFILIPTITLKPEEQIDYIEEDLCIEFPEHYTVKEKYEDWLGFEEHIELKFEFSEEDYDDLEEQAEIGICEKGKWEKKEGNYSFRINVTEEFPKYTYTGELDSTSLLLKYTFSNF